jgi:RP/EB family microtubule-associated protein
MANLAVAGSVSGANFSSRKDIILWIQRKYQPAFQRVEELHNGALYCVILDSVYPNVVHLKKVKLDAQQDKDVLANYVVLQDALEQTRLNK